MRWSRSEKLSFAIPLAFLGLAAVGFGWVKLPRVRLSIDAKATLKAAKADLAKNRQKDEFPNYVRLHYMAIDAAENLRLPTSFKPLQASFEAAFAKRDYARSADIADKMEKLLPRTHPTEYPFSPDFLIEWRVEIGTLRSEGADYAGALREFDLARTLKPLEPKDKMRVLDSEAALSQDGLGSGFTAGKRCRRQIAEDHRWRLHSYEKQSLP